MPRLPWEEWGGRRTAASCVPGREPLFVPERRARPPTWQKDLLSSACKTKRQKRHFFYLLYNFLFSNISQHEEAIDTQTFLETGHVVTCYGEPSVIVKSSGREEPVWEHLFRHSGAPCPLPLENMLVDVEGDSGGPILSKLTMLKKQLCC